MESIKACDGRIIRINLELVYVVAKVLGNKAKINNVKKGKFFGLITMLAIETIKLN